MMGALSRFISKSGEQGIPFYKLLKKLDGFLWSEQAEEAFQAFKQYLKQLPILVPPKDGETMLLYVAATPIIVSLVLVVEHQAKKSAKQHPMYFVSEVLHDARSMYPNIQKLLYAILMSSHKLKHYLLSHKIKVVSSYPLGTIIHNQDDVGRITQWSVELGQYNIEFVPRTVIKS
jgi:hypothetical protein